MARKRPTAMQEAAAALAAAAVESQTPDLDDVEAEISDDVLDGLRRLDQGGNRVTWYVYSNTPGKSGDSEGYIDKLRSEQLDEQFFKTRYGPGEYRVLGRLSDGHYVKGSHSIVKISDIGYAPAVAGSSPATDIVTYMREQRAADEARQKARGEDLKTYAGILAAPFGAIAAALIGRRPSLDIAALVTALKPAQAAPTLSDMTTALVNLKSIQGEGGGGGSVEVVLKVLERLQDLPQGQSEGGWLGFLRDVVKEAAPHAREILGRLQPPAGGALPLGSTSGPAFGPGVAPSALAPPRTNGATPPSGASEPSQPSPSSPPSGNPAPSGSDSDMWAVAEPWLRRRSEDLHEWAASNMDVELCAEVLLASVPKMFRAVLSAGDLVGFLQRPDWWGVLTTFHPPLAPYHAWIDDLRQEVLGLLMEEINGPPADTTDQGST